MTPETTNIAQNCLSRAKAIKLGLDLLLGDFGDRDNLMASIEVQLDLMVDDFASLTSARRADETAERLASTTERAQRSHPRI